MSLATYTFRRGETIKIALDCLSGSVASVSAINAKLRKLSAGARELAQAAPDAASFSIVTRAAAGDIPEGWTLTIPPATSLGLSAGAYVADARLTVAGDVDITESVTIMITEPATPA